MKYGAVIIDSRPLPEDVIERHIKYLPGNFELFHGALFTIDSIANYNTLLTSLKFWESLPFDKVLIFQHDSGLLRTGIEEFLQYDFIGAPIKHISFPAMNGGLSLRSTEAMIRCIKHTPYNPNIHGNEDMYFCNLLSKLGGKLPTKEVAQKFSVETIFNLGSLGYHAMNKYLRPEQCNQILNQYK
jgi:hypothetical protein